LDSIPVSWQVSRAATEKAEYYNWVYFDCSVSHDQKFHERHLQAKFQS